MEIGQATPQGKLIQRLLSNSGSKTDLEWAAKREIERLRDVVAAAIRWAGIVELKKNEPGNELVDRLERADEDLLKAIREYAREERRRYAEIQRQLLEVDRKIKEA